MNCFLPWFLLAYALVALVVFYWVGARHSSNGHDSLIACVALLWPLFLVMVPVWIAWDEWKERR